MNLHGVVLLFWLLIVLWAGRARAATVAIVRTSSSSPAFTEASFRLQGELVAVGLDVELIDPPPRAAQGAVERRDALEQMANVRGLSAIVDLVGEVSPTSVDIWIFQRSPRRFELSRVVLEPDAQRRSETLAIRAIEVLRSRFLELDLAGREKTSPSVVAPRVDAPAEPAPEGLPRLGLEAGAAVLTGVNGVGPAIMPLVRFDWVARSWLVAAATFAGLGTRPSIETETGSARVAQHYALLGLCYCLASDTGIRPSLSLSAGVLRTSLDGQAESPAHGHHVARWSFLMDGSLGARFPLTAAYYLTLASHVQLAEPYVAIHFADTVVATTGRPNLLFTLTLGTWL